MTHRRTGLRRAIDNHLSANLLTEDGVLAAQRDAGEHVRERSGFGVQLFGQLQKILAADGVESTLTHVALREAGSEQPGVGIHRRASEDQLGNRIERIMFDDAEDSAGP